MRVLLTAAASVTLLMLQVPTLAHACPGALPGIADVSTADLSAAAKKKSAAKKAAQKKKKEKIEYMRIAN